MSQQLKTQLQHAGVEEDTAYYIGRYTVSGLQYGCLLGTPLYLVQTLRGRGFTLRGLTRYNWLSPLAGAGVGSVAGYATASQLDHPSLTARTSGLRLDASRVRQDDLHLIGSVVGALVLPAVLLGRVGLINGLLGGAGLGGAAGLVTDRVQKWGKNGAPDVGSIEQEAKDAWTKAKGEAKQVKQQVESKL